MIFFIFHFKIAITRFLTWSHWVNVCSGVKKKKNFSVIVFLKKKIFWTFAFRNHVFNSPTWYIIFLVFPSHNWWGLEYTLMYFLKRCKTPSKGGVLGMILNYIWWDFSSGALGSAEYPPSLSLLFDLKCSVPVRASSISQMICIRIIHIWLEHLMSYNCKLFLLRKVTWSLVLLLLLLLLETIQLKCKQMTLNWNDYLVMILLLVLDMKIWNHTTVCNFFVLDIFDIIVCKKAFSWETIL